jgi:chromatin remodeling complex protein RSC6
MSSASKSSTKTPKTTAEPKVAKTTTKKSKAAATPAPAPEPVPEPTPAPVAETAPTETPIAQLSSDYYSKLTQLSTVITALKSEFKSLEKKYARDIKALEKLSSKKHRKRAKVEGGNDNSGFKKPTKISVELADFFGMPAGSMMARTEATKGINRYVKEHNLQPAKDSGKTRRIIEVHRDAKLKKLLRVPDGTELSFFNLQTFVTKHFAKKDDDKFVHAYE